MDGWWFREEGLKFFSGFLFLLRFPCNAIVMLALEALRFLSVIIRETACFFIRFCHV